MQLIEDEAIQWHLTTSKHDRCIHCGGNLGYLTQTKRCCMKCDRVFELMLTPAKWYKLVTAKELVDDAS